MTTGAPTASALFLRRRSTRQAVVLDPSPELGSGGEARVFALAGDETMVAKLYHRPTPERARKLALMIGSPPRMRDPHAALAWPVDLLSREDGRFAGFLMPRARGPRLFELYNPITRRRSGEPCDHGMLHRAGVRLATAFEALHAGGYVVGDVNESNVLLDAGGMLTLVDADSFQVRDPASGAIHRSKVGKAEFTPPELQGRPFADFDRTPEHDRFGLGVLLFLALMEGTHPFAGRMETRAETPPIEERIHRGLFAHRGHPQIRPPRLAPPFSILDPDLQALFVRCFVGGHADPAARPTGAEWRAALAAAGVRLVTCGANLRHRFGAHLDACAWCERTRLLHGRDPFPADPSRVADEIRSAPKPARVSSRAAPAARVPVPAVAPAPITPAPLGEQVVAGMLRPAAWFPPALALAAFGPPGVNLAALGVFVAALVLVFAGWPKPDPRVNRAIVFAISWMVTLAAWSIFLVADGLGAAGPAPVAVMTELPAPAPDLLASGYRVRVAEESSRGVDEPPALLNRDEVEGILAARASVVSGAPESWSMRIAVRVKRDGTVDPSSLVLDPTRPDLMGAVVPAAAEMVFRPITVGKRAEERWVWLHFSYGP